MGELEKKDSDVDCRAIKKRFLKKFKSGNYNVFLELVKKYSDELVLCFRGNNPKSEAVCIYYNNHLVYQIEYKEYKNKKEREKIIISFNHAKYSKKHKIFWRQLNKEYGFYPKEKDTGYITNDLNENILENVEKIYKNCLRPMMEDFFNPNKTKDYFKDTANEYPEYKGEITKTERKKSDYLEKKRQQQLFCAMKSTQNGLFVFDLEFSQKKRENRKLYGEELSNQPDMLAVSFDKDGTPQKYFLVEVKCRKDYDGKSGLMEHLKAMMQYPEEYKKARRREAALIMSQYKELGLYSFFGEIDVNVYEKLPIEIMLIFTDDAVSKYENEFDEKFKDAGLSNEYEKKPHGDLGIHLPNCKRLEIVEIKKI